MSRKKNYDLVLKFDDGFLFKFERDELVSTLFQDVHGNKTNYFYGEFKADAGKRKVTNSNNQEGLSLKDKLFDYRNVESIVLFVDQEDESQTIEEYFVDWKDDEELRNKLQSTTVEDDILCLEIGIDPYANY